MVSCWLISMLADPEVWLSRAGLFAAVLFFHLCLVVALPAGRTQQPDTDKWEVPCCRRQGASVTNPRIVSVEWARLEGRRPRNAGSNARLGEHGIAVRVPILRITTADGVARAAALQPRPLDRDDTGVGHASSLPAAAWYFPFICVWLLRSPCGQRNNQTQMEEKDRCEQPSSGKPYL